MANNWLMSYSSLDLDKPNSGFLRVEKLAPECQANASAIYEDLLARFKRQLSH